jgi:hypothetical protein
MRKLFAIFFLFVCQAVFAAELPKELYYKTDTGYVVLTTEPCEIEGIPQFKWKAYATEYNKNHPGCWYRAKDGVHIYYSDLDATGLYDPAGFKVDRDSI